MRITLAIIVALMLFKPNQGKSQVVDEGNLIFDVYYGFPNWYTVFSRLLELGLDAVDVETEVTNHGPIGFRGEYMIDERMSVGIDVVYSGSGLKYDRNLFVGYDTDNNEVYQNYNYSLYSYKIGFMATGNYHFYVDDVLDFYGVIGLGLKYRKFNYESNNPDEAFEDVDLSGLLGVASKVGLGLRFELIGNFGGNVGVGIGQGGLINAGLTLKM